MLGQGRNKPSQECLYVAGKGSAQKIMWAWWNNIAAKLKELSITKLGQTEQQNDCYSLAHIIKCLCVLTELNKEGTALSYSESPVYECRSKEGIGNQHPGNITMIVAGKTAK